MRLARGLVLVTLGTAFAASGCSGSGGVTDDSTPLATASASPQSGEAPLDVAFTGSVTDGDAPLTYAWDFGDGSSSTSQYPNHTYGTVGTYTASFTVTDIDGDSDTASVSVTVFAPGNPVAADAIGAPTSGRVPLPVVFSGSAIGGETPYSYAWNFGDGGTSNSRTPTHVYETAGAFTATLTVTDATSDTATATVSIDVADRDSLVASASATPTTGTAPLLVSLSCTANGGTAPFTYAWVFGDSATSTTQNPTHTYTDAGSYTATCTITDGDSATDGADVLINVGGANIPTVSVTASPTSGQADLDVNFFSTVTGGDAPVTHAWVFGDGSSSTDAAPSHTYTAGGSYTAQLTVEDADGDTATDSITISVSDDNFPSATISATPESGVAPLEVAFAAAVAGGDGTLTYAWNFGDGTTTNDVLTTTHTYTASGTYTATFTATDGDGDVAVDTIEISVGSNSLPVGIILADTYSGDAPLTVDFEGWVFGGDDPMTYSWTFGDGGTSTVKDPTNTFTSEGVYTVTFIVQDNNGDSDADSVDILVSAGLPDLEISLFDAVEVDGDILYEVQVHNGGTTDVGSFWVDVFHDEASAPLVGSNYGEEYQQVSGLAAGATDTIYFTWSDVLPGSYNSYAMIDTFNAISESDESDNVVGPETITIAGDPITETILSEDFEGSWVGAWLLYDDEALSGEDYWGDGDVEVHGGSWAAFCAATGDFASGGYDNDMDAYMEIEVDFSSYAWIDFETWVWYDLEDGYDYLYIEIDDGTTQATLRTYTGDGADWVYVYENLDAYAGSASVWLTFHFVSDGSVSSAAGAYVDDLLVEGTYFP